MKALALLSGGLDSRLAIKLLQEQGVKVEALHFKLPFEGCCLPDCAFKFAQLEGIRLHIIDATKGKPFQEYLKLVRKPRYGYGSGINPCIDCRIFMLKKAKKLAKRINADFIVTGEVLGERPMTQTRHALELIEKRAGLRNKILRPLSAKAFPETEAEKKGWVNRNKLLEIKGRRRTPQLDLAKKYKLKDFPMPGGGCTLCEKEFAKKVKDILKYKKRIKPEDIQLLKVGRHFRIKNNKIIVGRDEMENKILMKIKYKADYVFEVPNYGSPITLLQGKKIKKSIQLAAKLTASYSDAKGKKVLVKYGKEKPLKKIIIKQISKQKASEFRL